jgi:hypothetical protein
MLANGLVSKTEGWPEQLTRELMVNLGRNAGVSALHGLSPAGMRCRGYATTASFRKSQAELDRVGFWSPKEFPSSHIT